MNPSVYLCGPISGLTYEEATNGWRRKMSNHLMIRGIDCFSPMRAQRYLEDLGERALGHRNEFSGHPLSSSKGITTRDRFDTMRCSMMVANFLGATKVSIGSMIEFGWADANRTPILVIMEDEGNPHEHSMISELTGFRVNNTSAAIDIIEAVLRPGA